MSKKMERALKDLNRIILDLVDEKMRLQKEGNYIYFDLSYKIRDLSDFVNEDCGFAYVAESINKTDKKNAAKKRLKGNK